ncbi:MAG: hypothetical protein KKB88_00545 [Nanoarchaeota archaeon]|nr:hypothetical protein [Nanoarchaeota archaeon]
MSVKATENNVFWVIKFLKMQMNTKKLLVSFIAIMTVFCLVATVSAADFDITKVEVDGITIVDSGELLEDTIVPLTAGDTVSVEVWFTAEFYDEDVTVQIELEGNKDDTSAETRSFDVRPDRQYHKTLSIKVPYELKDELFDELTLHVEIDGADYNTENEYVLEVERPSYNTDIKSISIPQTIEAGETFPVDIVLKNIGYNDLDDLYVVVSIPELGLQRDAYFGDIVALECDEDDDEGDDNFPWTDDTLGRHCDEDDKDTVIGQLYLEVPYGVAAGVYTLEVEVGNEDTVSSAAKQIVIENDFETTVFVSGDNLWIVNPTNNVIGYRVIPESPASVSESIVFIPAGSSETIAVSPNADGAYSFDVNIFDMNSQLVKTVNFTGEAKTSTTSNPIVILTVILAIIFLVLLIVLIVLIGKKPEKSEEFGESYY